MDLLVVVLLFSTIFSADAGLKKGQIEEECLKEVGIERKVYDEAMDQNLKNADTKIKCMTKCLLKQYLLMKPDGTIDFEKTSQVVFSDGVANEESMKILETCTQTQDNECDTAYHMVTCVNKKLKGYGV